MSLRGTQALRGWVIACLAAGFLAAAGCAVGPLPPLPGTVSESGAPPGTSRIIVSETTGLLVVDPESGDATAVANVTGDIVPALGASSVLVRDIGGGWNEGILDEQPEESSYAQAAVVATYTLLTVRPEGVAGALALGTVQQRWADLLNACSGSVLFARTSTSPAASRFEYLRVDLATAAQRAVRFPEWCAAISPDGRYAVAWDHDHLVGFKTGRDNPVALARVGGGEPLALTTTKADTYEVRWSPDSRLVAVAAGSHGLVDEGPIQVYRPDSAAPVARIEAAWPVCWTSADTLCVKPGAYGLKTDVGVPSASFELWRIGDSGAERTALIEGIETDAQSVAPDPTGSGALAVLDRGGGIWLCAPGRPPSRVNTTADVAFPEGELWVPYHRKLAWVLVR